MSIFVCLYSEKCRFLFSEQNLHKIIFQKNKTWSLIKYLLKINGLSRWFSGKESTGQCWRRRFNPWVGKIPWVVAQSLIHVWLFGTPWTAAWQASLFFTSSQRLLKLMSIESVMPFNHLILCCSLLLLPSIFPSIRVFSSELSLRIRCPKYGASASASIPPVNIQDWFPLGLTGLMSLKSKGLSSIFFNTTVQKYQFFGTQPSLMVQLSHPCMTSGKTTALTRQTFVSPLSRKWLLTTVAWRILAWRIPMDRGAWQAIVHGVAKSWTWVSRSMT